MHPLAGQGVNQGFGDVTKLTEVLSKAVYDGSDLGKCFHLSILCFVCFFLLYVPSQQLWSWQEGQFT